MAQRVTTQLVDDLTGEVIADGAGRTVKFGLAGNSYEIDLTEEHSSQLEKALSEYIAAARRVGARSSRSSGTSSKRSHHADDLSKIREWANANGFEVAARGRISQEVRSAYEAAH